jgi:Zn ribbon nucleic-acid-binding protein
MSDLHKKVLRAVQVVIIVNRVNIMDQVSQNDIYNRSDEDIEAEANRKLSRFLKGARVYPIGITTTDFREHHLSDCPICNTGEKQSSYDARREHAICLSCGRATKHLQRSINATLRTMEEQMRFWRNFRLSLIRFRRKTRGKGNHGPRLPKAAKVMDAIRNGIAE